MLMLAAVIAMAVMLPAAISAQARFNQNVATVPEWSHTVKLPAPDSRTLVTDGRLTIDLTLGKPAVRPSATLAPDIPRYAYVYAIALHDTGDASSAIDVLTRAHDRQPAAREIILALAEYESERGNREAAAEWGRRLQALQDGS